MKTISLLFVGTLASIPIIGQLTPEGAVETMSVGTAQAVLAMVAVIEFLAIALMFSIWRKDIAKDRELDKENSGILTALLSKNSVALSDSAQACHRQSKSIDGLERSVGGLERSVAGFTAVVSKCDRQRRTD